MSIRLAFFFASLILVAVVHVIALELYLYWRFPWFDVPMHVLGGLCAALGYSILPFIGLRKKGQYETVLWYLGTVLAIGIAWEVFEYVAGISLVRETHFVLDTTLDMCMDLIGGLIGYWVARSATFFSA